MSDPRDGAVECAFGVAKPITVELSEADIGPDP